MRYYDIGTETFCFAWALSGNHVLIPLRMKSDERILGGGELTQFVLDEAKERLEERCRFQAQGYDLDKLTIRVSTELGVDPQQVWAHGKHPLTVKARSLWCYWAVRKLGYRATELSKKPGVSQPSVNISVKRDEKIAKAGI